MFAAAAVAAAAAAEAALRCSSVSLQCVLASRLSSCCNCIKYCFKKLFTDDSKLLRSGFFDHRLLMVQLVLLARLLLLLLLAYCTAEKLSSVSFTPPFEKHDRTGARIIGTDWSTDGVTKIAKNFVRLTPDRSQCSATVCV
jgi:hypothetical protein